MVIRTENNVSRASLQSSGPPSPCNRDKTDHKYLNIQCSFIMESKHVQYFIFDFFISAFVSSKNVSVVRCSYIKEQF